MGELDIFAAIGGVDEDLLLERPRRVLPRKLGLVAAVLAVVVLTACAPVVVRSFKALTGGEAVLTRESYMDRVMVMDNETGDIVGMSSREEYPAEYEITLDVEAECRRPDTLEELYAPGWVPEGYVSHFERSGDDCRTLRYVTGSGLIESFGYVEFRQSLLPEGNPVTVTDSFAGFRTLYVNDMHSEYVTYGEATVLELRREMDAEEAMIFSSSFMQISRFLYWSDGAYLFRLEVPYYMEDDVVAQIIASVTAAQMP